MNKIWWKVTATLVVATMIGTGVFTNLGFQLQYVTSRKDRYRDFLTICL